MTRDYLREVFHYDANTGLLYNKISKPGVRFAKVAGSRSHPGRRDPYIRIMLDGTRYYAHRLIWVYHYGHIPRRKFIDHINGNALDNRIENLRLVSYRENYLNSRRSVRNKSGVTGVYQRNGSGKWYAVITTCGTSIQLGTFDKKEDAIKARRAAERKYGFHRNHGRDPVEYKIPNVGNDEDALAGCEMCAA